MQAQDSGKTLDKLLIHNRLTTEKKPKFICI